MDKPPRRIFGTENEFGFLPEKGVVLETEESFRDYIQKRLEKAFLQNGSFVYEDCGHPEYASPETTNVLDAIRWQKAGELIIQKAFPCAWKNTVDCYDHTFGAHVNYFTNVPRKKLKALIPFLITNKIFTGAGNIAKNGDFGISERAPHVIAVGSNVTVYDRAIINERNEPLSNVKGWHRLHYIAGDAHMCEAALGLELGTTDLMLRLLEDEERLSTPIFPRIEYDETKAIHDLHAISRQTKGWTLTGAADGEPQYALDLQQYCLEAAWQRYRGQDEITDLVLETWQEVLSNLERNPESLFGVVDWITKREILKINSGLEELSKDNWLLKTYDLEYHDVNRETSIFYKDLEQLGGTRRWVQDSEITAAVTNPPTDTRAYFRGKILQAHQKVSNRKTIVYMDWDRCFVLPGKEFIDDAFTDDDNPKNYRWGSDLPDPRRTYGEKLERALQFL